MWWRIGVLWVSGGVGSLPRVETGHCTLPPFVCTSSGSKRRSVCMCRFGHATGRRNGSGRERPLTAWVGLREEVRAL